MRGTEARESDRMAASGPVPALLGLGSQGGVAMGLTRHPKERG